MEAFPSHSKKDQVKRALSITGIVWITVGAIIALGQAKPPIHPRVTLTSSGTAIKTITEIGRRAKLPIGIILGKDYARLCRVSGSFDFSDSDARDDLRKVAGLADYEATEEHGTVLLTPPDMLPWQEDVLNHRFKNFRGFKNATMADMGMQLTGLIQMGVGRVPTFAYSLAYSLNDLRISLPPMGSPSTEEIAEQIVSLDGGGIWMMKPLVPNPQGAKDVVITIMSYRDRPSASAIMGCSPG